MFASLVWNPLLKRHASSAAGGLPNFRPSGLVESVVEQGNACGGGGASRKISPSERVGWDEHCQHHRDRRDCKAAAIATDRLIASYRPAANMARGKSRNSAGPRRSESSPSVARWDQADEIPLDEEESFHAGRDKVLLNGAGGDDDDESDEGECSEMRDDQKVE